ncbi:hypothetical protein EWM64_g4683, partial [Hericium alpestre]
IAHNLHQTIHCDSPIQKQPPSTSTNPDAPQKPAGARALIPYSELQRHNTRGDLWVLIDGEVYNATGIIDTHPGGVGPLLKNGGKDATKAFKPIHPPGTLSSLPTGAHIGSIDPATIPKGANEPTAEELRIAKARDALPAPQEVLNLSEIEALAQTVLTATAWGYYRSAGDDNNTFDENRNAFKRFWFRPRVLNKISHASTESTLFGLPVSLPIWIAPAALARLGHPDGEMNLTRAAGKEGIIHGISSNSSCSIDEITSVKDPKQHLIFQLYVNRHRPATAELLPTLRKRGFSALMLTVDAAVSGKRELDMRMKGDFDAPSNGKKATENVKGVGQSIMGYQDPDVCWDDIPWIRSLTDLPLILKGIQCVEDAEKAFDQYKVDAIILSNHGGRDLDFSPSPMTLLYELRQRRPDLLEKHEVHIDGGVTRGTDVLKALCLGAKGVGLGRAFLYANGCWGEEGVQRVIEIMREEIIRGMQFMGVTSLDQLGPHMVRYEPEAAGRTKL